VDVMHSNSAGLDIHKDTVVAAIRLHNQGQVTRVTRTFGTMTKDLLALQDWLDAQHITHVAMEATGVYWKPIWHVLENGFELLLINPAHVKAVPGRKSDVNDAQWIAELLAHGLLKSSFVPATPIQDLRELTRTRKQLIREKVRYAQRLQKTLEDANIKLSSVASDILGVSGQKIMQALIAGERDPKVLASLAQGKLKTKIPVLEQALYGRFTAHHQFMLSTLLQQVHALEGSIAKLDARIEEMMRPFNSALALLVTIPGVGLETARVIVAELGVEMTRFPSADHLVSWVGLCPRLDESAGKRRSTRIRMGNAWLKTALVQASQVASRASSGYVPSRFQRLKTHRGAKKAIVANAAFLLRAVWHVLSRFEPFRDLGEDFFEGRGRDRQVEKLMGQLKALGVQVVVEQAA
jgi:transposase